MLCQRTRNKTKMAKKTMQISWGIFSWLKIHIGTSKIITRKYTCIEKRPKYIHLELYYASLDKNKTLAQSKQFELRTPPDVKTFFFFFLARKVCDFVKMHFSNVSAVQKIAVLEPWAVVHYSIVVVHRNALMCTHQLFYYRQLYPRGSLVWTSRWFVLGTWIT